MIVSGVYHTINGKVMIAEITPEGDIFPLGFSSLISDLSTRWSMRRQNLVDVGATYSGGAMRVPSCHSALEHILMSASHVAYGTELTSLYLPHKYGHEEGDMAVSHGPHCRIFVTPASGGWPRGGAIGRMLALSLPRAATGAWMRYIVCMLAFYLWFFYKSTKGDQVRWLPDSRDAGCVFSSLRFLQ